MIKEDEVENPPVCSQRTWKSARQRMYRCDDADGDVTFLMSLADAVQVEGTSYM
jgi:hypothetical protein